MAKVSIGFGIVLIVIGIIGFMPAHAPTALIPAYFGIGMAICGVIALNPAARMHAMHGAVMIGLLGFLGSTAQFLKALFGGGSASWLKFFSIGSMAVLTFIFVLLCIRSFIEARRKRELGTP